MALRFSLISEAVWETVRPEKVPTRRTSPSSGRREIATFGARLQDLSCKQIREPTTHERETGFAAKAWKVKHITTKMVLLWNSNRENESFQNWRII